MMAWVDFPTFDPNVLFDLCHWYLCLISVITLEISHKPSGNQIKLPSLLSKSQWNEYVVSTSPLKKSILMTIMLKDGKNLTESLDFHSLEVYCVFESFILWNNQLRYCQNKIVITCSQNHPLWYIPIVSW